jgi:hypothetical protein
MPPVSPASRLTVLWLSEFGASFRRERATDETHVLASSELAFADPEHVGVRGVLDIGKLERQTRRPRLILVVGPG